MWIMVGYLNSLSQAFSRGVEKLLPYALVFLIAATNLVTLCLGFFPTGSRSLEALIKTRSKGNAFCRQVFYSNNVIFPSEN